ncbi:MAG TPA: NAD(P)/FAD-dependent oxidoreductase, partial [Bacteroidota bacterium]|nr:NAD(P)/FAD-dependent oxidoreductase [Bacteroidota bacterium]
MNDRQITRILILGGGFGGLYAAFELERALGRIPGVQITLVNKENFFLFTPLLHEVAASDLDITHIVNPLRTLLRHVQFFDGDVESIDLRARRVSVSHGREHHHHELSYDYLLIGLGSVTNFRMLPGAEHALTMKSLGDAIHLRNRLIELLEAADFDCFPEAREPLLTVVVTGGGFAGVETVAAANDFLRESLRYYPHLKEHMLRIVLVHSGEVILPELPEKLGAYAQRKLAERHVEVRTCARVESFHRNVVLLDDGTKLRTNTLVWTAGTSPNPMLESLPCAKEHGRIIVNDYLEVPGFPGVWALGDCACVPDASTGKRCPPTAQHALREGKCAGRNIAAAVQGRRKRPFRFKQIGALAAIGRRTGVARLFGVNFSGFLAWWMWRTIYLSKLPRFEKKFRVALDWTLDLIFGKDLVQFETLRAPTISHAHASDGQGPLGTPRAVKSPKRRPAHSK